MAMIDVNGAGKKHRVMSDTWGHLYPQPGSKHAGYFIVAADDGHYNLTILRSEFPTLECSPQRAQLESTVFDFIRGKRDNLALYRIDCVMWFYQTCNDYNGALGKIIKPVMSEIKLSGV